MKMEFFLEAVVNLDFIMTDFDWQLHADQN